MGNYSAASIPLDTVWSDIDFMDAYRDFTVDPVAFPLPKLQQFVAKLHANKQHYVVIVDPGKVTKKPLRKNTDVGEESFHIQRM